MSRLEGMDWPPPSMSDETYNEVLQGVPTMEEPFIKKYLSGRDSLIAQEKMQRSDVTFKQSLSPLAREACAIVERIRDEEQRDVWSAEYEDTLAQETFALHPGMSFRFAKGRMENTRLWHIVKKMPKGSLLHAHLDAMVDFPFLFEQLLSTPGIHVLSPEPLSTPQRLKSASFGFRFCKNEKSSETSIWSSDYTANEPVPIAKAVESFPDGGREGFFSWMKERCTITHEESIKHHRGVDAIWRKFTSIFPILDSIIFYEPIFRAFLQRLFQMLLDDGVKWVELRQVFAFYYYREGQDTPEVGYEELLRVFSQELEQFKCTSKEAKCFGARIIWTSIRSLNTRRTIEDIDNLISMKLAFPDLIAGYDLVGQEDGPGSRHLKDLLPELFWFRKQCAEEGVEIPFFFHAGECLGDGDETDQNLYDAILLGTRRIGHGFSLYKHPLLIDMVKEKKILIESCPISNEVLRLCGSILSHPLPALLARGVPCALCNDDPAILGQDTSGMTHDFWQALQGWKNLGLAGLGSLAENSVRWAVFEDQNNAQWIRDIKEATLGSGIKAERLKEWSIEWEQYCLWIVTEFGGDRDSSGKFGKESSLDAQD